MKTHLTIVVVLLSGLILGARCASEGTGSNPSPVGVSPAKPAPAPAEPAQGGPSQTQPATPGSVADLCRDPAKYADKPLTLRGTFQGFRVAECRFPEPASQAGLTRSDWLFRTGGDCLYVTGGAPPGVDAVDPSFIGRRIDLTARISRNAEGRILLAYVTGSLATD